MIEYKNAEFYTEYFKNIEGISVLEDFKESKEEKDKNLYIGSIEILEAIHPLVIRVEIPITFPHNKLVFRTKSLSGYPHLIHSGKVEDGDWFCLNTPFAETPVAQLDLEVLRLKEWVSRQMREDLPPYIDDNNFKRALAFANAYDWENPDEVQEFSSKAILTFVGDFHDKTEHFTESIGYLNCIKSPDNRLYVVREIKSANYKLPYIILDEAPPTEEVVSDFIKLKDHYGWDDNICKHLLPDIEMSTGWHGSSTQTYNLRESKMSVEEKLSLITKVEEELLKEDSYLPGTQNILSRNWKQTKVLPSQKTVLLDKIQKMKEEVGKPEKENKLESFIGLDYDSMTEEEMLEDQYNQYYFEEVYPFEWHKFALGLRHEGKVMWLLMLTNRCSTQTDSIEYDLGIKFYRIEKIIGQNLRWAAPQIVSETMFFGRGAFDAKMTVKKVALVGLGAIGSMVAEALAKSGIKHIALWDSDIVEPGNICRSSYCLEDLGESKVRAVSKIMRSINPFIETVIPHGYWHVYGANHSEYSNGSFYANVNYQTQEKAINEIKGYDLIIDCTGSNEMLHFLSYAVAETDIISLCITNHANELLCISNRDGNPFELRKAYLSRIEQDTKNFYVEGSGCYSPTFLASNCDIAALVNMALREINFSYANGHAMPSTIYSYTNRGIVADKLHTYKLPGYEITLNISSETMYDAEDIEDAASGELGYLFGCYDRVGKQIMITHVVDSYKAIDLLADAYRTSKGIIDYIGDYTYSGEHPDTYNHSSLELVALKAEDSSINTNNPLLAVRNPDQTISFFLYINNELVKFIKQF